MKNFFLKDKLKIKNQQGFLLVELIVSLFIFGIVATVSLTSVITIFDSNKKAQSLQSVMDNLNLAVDSMSKALAVGTNYSMSGQDITFTSQDNQTVKFAFYNTCPSSLGGGTNGCLSRTVNGKELLLTAKEVNIENVTFNIHGIDSGDNVQPRVSIFIKGITQAGPRNQTQFSLQTLVSQRSPDF